MILGWRKIDQNTICANTVFTNRVINIWNSLPIDVVLCDTDNKFKSYLDKFWQCQNIVYDYKTKIHGTGSRNSQFHITRTSYIGYQYFVSFVFVIRA